MKKHYAELVRKLPSPEARIIYDEIGNGMLLAIVRGGDDRGKAFLLKGRYGPNEDHEIPRPIADEIVDSGLVFKLSEYRSKKKGKGGWRELDVPGNVYHIYSLVK